MILSAPRNSIERPVDAEGVSPNGRAPHAWSGHDAAGEGPTPESVMQVNCPRCSQPIALTDIIESNDGLLSHVDCKRPKVLTPEERALVFVYCSGHVVADARGVT